MPVAIAPVDGQVGTATIEFIPDRCQQGDVLLVDRALAAEVVVVLGHFKHALSRHVASAEDVFQKRNHVVGAVGAAERNEQHGVVE